MSLPSDAPLLNFLEQSPDGLVIHRGGIVQYVNPAIMRWMGFTSPDEVIGKPVLHWVHPDDRPAVVARIQAAQHGHAAPVREERFVRGDGQVRTFEVSSQPMEFAGDQCICVLIRDNTQRVRAEQERTEALAKAERALHARDDLLAIVSHDLRNPLAAIRSSADLIVRTQTEGDTHALRAAHTILRAALRMDRLITDLLDAGRIEAGLMNVTQSEERFSDVIEEAIDTLRPLAETRRVGLVLSATAPSLGLKVHCEHGRLVQVLSNLVGNALQVAPSGTTVNVDVEHESPMLKVSVKDEGPGIDPGEVDQLFERFYRSKLSSYPGSGLGLFIAKGIVDAHGGSIGVENRSERGCVFWFKVPATP